MSIDVGVWTRTLSEHEESGDQHFVKIVPKGMLICVLDGLGHGGGAAVAAAAAIRQIDAYAEETLPAMFQRCHLQLKNTRGVVMSLALFNDDNRTMTWLGVGNVEGLLLRADPHMKPARETLMLRGGVVGLQLPQVASSVITVFPGDTLILATDGISASFADGNVMFDSPQRMADRIGNQFKKGTDDALVLVARYNGNTNVPHTPSS